MIAQQEMKTRCSAMIGRFSPKSSAYIKALDKNPNLTQLVGILKALRADYEAGYMVSLIETINADLFSDMLEMASHFLEVQKLKMPSAVMAGGVLEEHLRKLCVKNGIDTNGDDGKLLKASALNAALKREEVYGKNEQKQVEAWQGIRNSAAHNKDDEYDKTQVKTMIDGIRGFISKYPA